MTEKQSHVTPTEINLHQKSRVLEIAFSDGSRFALPCEYLRVFSPSAEVKVMQQPVHGKQAVNISQMEPMGTYALRLLFDDGHDTGIYSWSTLHALGTNYEQNWADYLQQLKHHHLSRDGDSVVHTNNKTTIKLLYFMQLANISGTDQEEVELPEAVNDVAALLTWMRGRGKNWHEAFADNKVQVTVNKQFAALDTPVKQGDEVALVPRSQ